MIQGFCYFCGAKGNRTILTKITAVTTGPGQFYVCTDPNCIQKLKDVANKGPSLSPTYQPCSYSEPPPKPEPTTSTEYSVVWINCNCGWKSNNVMEYAEHASKCPQAPKSRMDYKEALERMASPFTPPTNFPPLDKPESVCAEADRIINGERRSDYGPVEKSFQDYAAMWSVIFKCSVTPSQVALAMACLKICRELNGHKRDSVVDAIGYLALVQRIEENKEGQ